MTIADYEQVFALWNVTPGIGMRNLDDSKLGIQKFLERNPCTCFAAEYEGTIIGSLLSGHDGRRGFIYHTAVKPEYQGQGIGKSLVSAVESAFRDEGIHKIALVAFKTNEQGNQFWEKEGFLVRNDLVYRNKSLTDKNQ